MVTVDDGVVAERPAPGPREVLGVPMLPPARMLGVVDRLRAALAALRRAPAPPPVRVLEAVLAVLDQTALVALCRAGVPDRLDGPTPLKLLAHDLGVDPDRLERLLRYGAVRGWVRIDRRGRVRPTPTTTFLRRDHPGGWRAWVEFMGGDEVARAVGRLDAGLQSGGDPFRAGNGAPFFAWMEQHPQRHAAFDAAMAAGGRMHGLVLARALDWSGRGRVCDVGGGTGALLHTLLDARPRLEGVLLELPEVAARARPHPRLTTIAGDAFTEVPAGFDTYLLVNVLHDWDDDAAARLLARCAAVVTTGGAQGVEPRVVIVENRAHRRPRDDLSLRTDLLMLALTPGGRERSAATFDALARPAGLRLARSVPLASGVAHVLVPVRRPRAARRGAAGRWRPGPGAA